MKNEDNTVSTCAWPPTYIIKKNVRARHFKLTLTPTHGLKITVPSNFDHRYIPILLEQHKTWIEQQYAKIVIPSAHTPLLPFTFNLLAVQQQWEIKYIQSQRSVIKLIIRPNQEIVLCGNIDNKILCKKILLSWIRRKAKEYLIPWLNQLSIQTNLPYRQIYIRSQCNRWGSCSAKKNINLNDKLLFLPSHLVSHVLLHELCHLVHLNHSPSFWKLLSSFDSLYKENKNELRSININLISGIN